MGSKGRDRLSATSSSRLHSCSSDVRQPASIEATSQLLLSAEQQGGSAAQRLTTGQSTICYTQCMAGVATAAAHHQALEDLLHGGGHSHLLIHPQVGRQAALHVAAQGKAEQVRVSK